MAHVYILQNKHEKFCIGSATNLSKRLKHHDGGHTPSTKRLGKMRLVFSQEYEKLSDARSIERKLKQLKRRDYIEKIISDGFIKMNPDTLG